MSLNLINRIDYSSLLSGAIVERNTDRIGFYISSIFHLFVIFIALGMPTCFGPTEISVPNIIPIEILTVDDVTRIPEKTEDVNKLDEAQPKKVEEKKFSAAEQNEIIKIQEETEKFEEVEIEKPELIIEPPKDPEIVKDDIVQKDQIIENNEKYETLPSKDIKPKLKPKPEPKTSSVTERDISVKIKKKPKPKFKDILSSVIKDIRNDDIQPVQEDDKNKEKVEDDETGEDISDKDVNNFTISEIDLLKQQLYGCWTVPAGAKGAKDMVVKVRVWVNPDRTVNKARILDTNKMQNDPYFRSVAESALRAVLNPACSPLKLPAEKYDVWKKFIFKFELGWMLGN